VKRVVDAVQIVVLVGTVVFVVALFTNDGGGGAAPAPDGGVDGAAVYQDNCAACHGGDGQGLVGPALGGGAVVEAYPDPADQVAVVADGLPNGMPSFGANLTPEELEAVVAYTRDDL